MSESFKNLPEYFKYSRTSEDDPGLCASNPEARSKYLKYPSPHRLSGLGESRMHNTTQNSGSRHGHAPELHHPCTRQQKRKQTISPELPFRQAQRALRNYPQADAPDQRKDNHARYRHVNPTGYTAAEALKLWRHAPAPPATPDNPVGLDSEMPHVAWHSPEHPQPQEPICPQTPQAPRDSPEQLPSRACCDAVHDEAVAVH